MGGVLDFACYLFESRFPITSNFYALGVILAATLGAEAKIFDCTLTPHQRIDRDDPSKMIIDLEARPGAVVIADNIGPKVGRPNVIGKVNRYVGADMLFNLQLSDIPIALKPPTETKDYQSTVTYSGRLDRNTGALRIVGSFVTSASSANTGLNMRAQGTCN